jgi:pimeloyl-ACP methyl ester carboxylesterase
MPASLAKSRAARSAVETEPRIASVVALAPGGASRAKPGILPAKLAFAWPHQVPTLYLVAEDDTSLPLSGMIGLFQRTPGPRRMLVLRRADHMHFMDDVEAMHEAVRGMPMTGELAWLPGEMRPIEELCSGEKAHGSCR